MKFPSNQCNYLLFSYLMVSNALPQFSELIYYNKLKCYKNNSSLNNSGGTINYPV